MDGMRRGKGDGWEQVYTRFDRSTRSVAIVRSTDPHIPTQTQLNRRKKEAREAHRRSKFAQKVHGLRAKLYNAKRYKEKAQMRKT